jgi:anti-sigma factor RsiW
MSCLANMDLKAYALEELSRAERGVVEDHVRACQSCSDELDRLALTRSALASLEDEEIPRRISFVSDRVFEPRWWQTIWHSGPVMGFASASVLAAAILVHGFAVHGFARPLAAPLVAGDVSGMEQRVEAQVSARLDSAVAKAVGDAQAKQTAEFAKVLKATELQRQSDLANFQQAAEYYEKQVHRFEVASNEGPAQ